MRQVFETNEKPRVLMLCPDTQMMDRRVLQQGRSLIDAGYGVTLLCGFECSNEEHYALDGIDIHRYKFDWNDERLKVILSRVPNRQQVHKLVHKAFYYFSRHLTSISSYDAFILHRAEQFRAEAVHVHDLPLLRHGKILARRWGVPLVFDAHEIYFEQSCLGAELQEKYRVLEKRLIRSVDQFITVNDPIADHYGLLYRRRPMVLFNATDTPQQSVLRDGRHRLRERAGLPQDAQVVLFQGWFSPQRNLDTLVASAEFLPSKASVVLIGYGAYEAELRQQLVDKPWANKVRFLGQIDPDEILGLTAGADLGIIPYQPIDLNHVYCSPNKFFEFVQTGVPVVAHDLDFFRGMRAAHGVVALGNLSTPQSMAKAINAVLEDPMQLNAMKAACRKAAETLNWEVEGQKLVETYARIVPIAAQPLGELRRCA